MIARTWHGLTPSAMADEYVEYLYATGVPGLRQTPGNRGVWVLRRPDGERAHFWVISFWESEEAIRRYAGDVPARARYYPRDREYLLELEPEVTHYEVCAGPAGEPAGGPTP